MSLKLPESGGEKNEIVAGLARLAKEIVGGVRKNADEKMDDHQLRTAKLVEGLDGIANAFDTDPEAGLTNYQMEAKQATAVVNFIRSLLNLDPLGEGEEVDLDRDLVAGKGKPSVLNVGGRRVSYEGLDFSKIKDTGERIVQAAMASVLMKERVKPQPGKGACCWDWIKQVYDAAGVKEGPVLYSEAINKRDAVGTLDYDTVVPGSWLYIFNGNRSGGEHSVVFSKWIDEEKHIAEVMSYPGAGYNKPQRVHTVDFEKQRITRVTVPVPKRNIA